MVRRRDSTTAGPSFILFTCRSQADVPDEADNFLTHGCLPWSLEDLDPDHQNQFIQRWLRAWHAAQAPSGRASPEAFEEDFQTLSEQLGTRSYANPDFAEIAAMPLHLDMICRL